MSGSRVFLPVCLCMCVCVGGGNGVIKGGNFWEKHAVFFYEEKYCFKTRFDLCNLHIFTLENKG